MTFVSWTISAGFFRLIRTTSAGLLYVLRAATAMPGLAEIEPRPSMCVPVVTGAHAAAHAAAKNRLIAPSFSAVK